jgi:hypothetical protein
VFLVRTDAPRFKDQAEAVKWIEGKQVAIPKGSCADRFAEVIFQNGKVKPAAYLNQNIEVITSGFRAGKIDATVIWEPVASRLAKEGLARRVLSGVNFNEMDGAFLIMRADLIKQRPDIVKGWLNCRARCAGFPLGPRKRARGDALGQELHDRDGRQVPVGGAVRRVSGRRGRQQPPPDVSVRDQRRGRLADRQATTFLHSIKAFILPSCGRKR